MWNVWLSLSLFNTRTSPWKTIVVFYLRTNNLLFYRTLEDLKKIYATKSKRATVCQFTGIQHSLVRLLPSQWTLLRRTARLLSTSWIQQSCVSISLWCLSYPKASQLQWAFFFHEKNWEMNINLVLEVLPFIF